MNTKFYFATSQVGAEKWIKDRLSRSYPDLKFAFSRPGFITFKQDAGPLVKNGDPVFARVWGQSLGQVKKKEMTDPEWATALREFLSVVPKGAIVHAYERDQAVPGDEPDLWIPNARINKMLNNELSFLKDQAKLQLQAKGGEQVYDLIWLDEGHLFLGSHTHAVGQLGSPGNILSNIPAMELPKKSPARSYLKIVEAILRFEPSYKKGLKVLEIGCSPGGASMAMLDRGFKVLGIDPKFMHESIHAYADFGFIQKMAINVMSTDLGEFNPNWLVMDMNLAPLEAIDELNHIVSMLKQNLGRDLKLDRCFITLKLNDRNFSENIPLYLKRLSACGFRDLVPVQLSTNRQEFFVYGKFQG